MKITLTVATNKDQYVVEYAYYDDHGDLIEVCDIVPPEKLGSYLLKLLPYEPPESRRLRPVK